jgi:hypothetical protein
MSVDFADEILHVETWRLSAENSLFPTESVSNSVAGGPPVDAIATALAVVVPKPLHYSTAVKTESSAKS